MYADNKKCLKNTRNVAQRRDISRVEPYNWLIFTGSEVAVEIQQSSLEVHLDYCNELYHMQLTHCASKFCIAMMFTGFMSFLCWRMIYVIWCFQRACGCIKGLHQDDRPPSESYFVIHKYPSWDDIAEWHKIAEVLVMIACCGIIHSERPVAHYLSHQEAMNNPSLNSAWPTPYV